MENLENIKKEILKINPKVNIHIGKYVPQNLDELDNKEDYLVFSGIGNHKTFLSMLKVNNFKIIKDIEFPDHYYYSKKIKIRKKINLFPSVMRPYPLFRIF